MNTQGWVRGIMSKNFSSAKYFEHVAECIGREFGETAKTVITDCFYGLSIGEFNVFIPKDEAVKLQDKSPYSLDKHILEKLIEQGFRFDKYRSQYVRYCFGLFYKREDGTVY